MGPFPPPRVRRLALVALGLLCALSGFAAGEAESTPAPPITQPDIRLQAPDAVMQGQVLAVRIDSPWPLRLQAAWFPSLHAVATLPPLIPLGPSPAGWSYALVIGVAVDAPPGESRLVVSAWTDSPADGPDAAPALFPAWQNAPGSLRQFDRTITVRKTVFRSEEIVLTPGMSDIKTVPDPKKDEQIRRYGEILAKTDPSGIWLKQALAGSFLRPVASDRHTSWFGDNRVYRYPDGSRERSWHFGVDYGVPTGTPVLAPARGRVVLAENRITTGWTVILEHLPGMYTVYMHMSKLQVIVGQVVEQADRLGESGATGFATGPHLHWELRVGGVACDPEGLFAEKMD